MIKAIEEYIDERKKSWLDKKIKSNSNDADALRQTAEIHFSYGNWIQDASERAAQLKIVSHAPKLTHPDAKASAFIYSGVMCNDGYVRTGNMTYPNDVYGNAAAMDVYRFLSIQLNGQYTVLDAFEKGDPSLKEYIESLGLQFDTVRENFLKTKYQEADKLKTSHLLKQVFFPVGDNQYHLLSIVSATGMMAELNRRIIDMRSNAKTCRDKIKDNSVLQASYQQISNLTKIGFGGSKPQNISSINQQQRGVFFLLPSLPPQWQEGTLRLPTEDFFRQILNARDPQFQCEFELLQRWINSTLRNKSNRESIKRHILRLVDHVLWIAQQYQMHPAGWSNSQEYLPMYQKIWLDAAYSHERETDNSWREMIADRIARWIIMSWEQYVGKQQFGDEEIHEIKRIVLTQEENF